MEWLFFILFFFFFNDTATTEIYTLSLHDALPIRMSSRASDPEPIPPHCPESIRSEEHTSELQSRFDLVCRLLLEKKKIKLICILPHKKKKYKTYEKHITTRC